MSAWNISPDFRLLAPQRPRANPAGFQKPDVEQPGANILGQNLDQTFSGVIGGQDKVEEFRPIVVATFEGDVSLSHPEHPLDRHLLRRYREIELPTLTPHRVAWPCSKIHYPLHFAPPQKQRMDLCVDVPINETRSGRLHLAEKFDSYAMRNLRRLFPDTSISIQKCRLRWTVRLNRSIENKVDAGGRAVSRDEQSCRKFFCSGDHHYEPIEVMLRFCERITDAVNVRRRGCRNRFGVCMPITDEVKSLAVHRINLALFLTSVRNE